MSEQATPDVAESQQQQVEVDPETPLDSDSEDLQQDLPWYKFEGFEIAQGYNSTGIGRGALIMSNIFLSTAIIYLAEEQAGCLDEDGETIEDCDGQVYGFKPASFVANIAVVAGVLSALFMPFIGAMVDCTDHRKQVGTISAVVIMIIQVVQIGTNSNTWFPMTCLQALSGFLYQAQVLANYSYLPDMAYEIGEETLNRYTNTFVMSQFSSQSAFLVVVIALSSILDLNDVSTAQVSQGINTVWSGLFLYLGWKLLKPVKARRVLPEGRSLFVEGFSKVFQTAKEINQKYKIGSRWYFLALIFAEASVNAFTVVAVVFLGEHLDMGTTEIGIFFLVTLVFSLPGSLLGHRITTQLDPKRSWQLCMLSLCLWSAGGALLLDVIPTWMSFIWGCGIGIHLGWYYPVENLFFAMCLPKGQEAELAGFFVYCTQILGWLPPLIFSFMVEADVSQTYGVVTVTGFFPVAIAIVGCAGTWDEILIDSGRKPTRVAAEEEPKATEKNSEPDSVESQGQS